MPTRRIKLPIQTSQWPAPDGYPELLVDDRAIADHIVSLSPGEIDEEMVEECFRGCRARLSWIPIDQITPGHADTNIPNPKREAKYAKLPLQTMPPIVIDQGEIQDGNHRFRVAQAAGAVGLWCYCVEEVED